MELLDFARYPLWLNLVLTGVASVAVWIAGTRLTREADVISKRTGAGEAFVGLILLGAVVSLPELSTSITASRLGNPGFAVSTLVGGVSAVMVALAVVDALSRDEPVSSDVRHPIVLLQGALTVLFLVVAAAGMVVGGVTVFGVGAWSIALLVLYLLFVLLVKRYQWREPWVAGEEVRASIRRPPEAGIKDERDDRERERGRDQGQDQDQDRDRGQGVDRDQDQDRGQDRDRGQSRGQSQDPDQHRDQDPPQGYDRKQDRGDDARPLSRVILATVVSAVVTLAAGIVLAGSGSAISDQTGLGAGFVGMLIGGIATSLPEATTFYAAVRIREYELAFGDAFGTNLFSTMAIFFADLAYDGGPILVEAGRFGIFAILLGIAVNATYLAGCIERRNRKVLGMGVDSLVVIAVYVGGLVVLYGMR